MSRRRRKPKQAKQVRRWCTRDDLTYNYDTFTWECANCFGFTGSKEEWEDHIEMQEKMQEAEDHEEVAPV